MAALRYGILPLNKILVRSRHHDPMARLREALIEFHQVGAYVKVSAVDPDTLTEVSIVGDPAAGQAALERAALRKLEYVLDRAKAEAARSPVTNTRTGA